MPRYFFDAYDGRQSCIDPQGELLGSDQEARDQAFAIIKALVRDDARLGDTTNYHVSVRRDGTFVVYQLDCALTDRWAFREETIDHEHPRAGRDLSEALRN